jgi:hypothetical protein
MADKSDASARAERSDAALVAQYIHELSERHGSEPDGLGSEREVDGEEG